MPKPICYSPFLRYVFIHIPKCAGSSIHRALGVLHAQRSFIGPEAQISLSMPKRRRCAKSSGLPGMRCFKFAFIRNPWDLMVSSYHWWLTYAEIFPALHKDIARIREMGSFSVFIRSEFGRSMLNEHRGGDLTEWISDGDEIIVDFVGRYETLNEDWSKVCRALKVPALPLGRENQVVRQDYRVFMITSRGSSWRIALPARLSYSVIVSIASRRLKNFALTAACACVSPSGREEREEAGTLHRPRREQFFSLGEKARMRVFQQSARL